MFLPLSLKPLHDPSFDPGESIVMDAETAHVTTVTNREFADAAVKAINENAKLRDLLVHFAKLGDFSGVRPNSDIFKKVVAIKQRGISAID
jgi:hypothetical protein